MCLVIHDGVKLLSKCAPDGTVVYSKVNCDTKLTTSEDALYYKMSTQGTDNLKQYTYNIYEL